MIAIDQYGNQHYLPGVHPRKELLQIMDCKHAAKMYRDKKDGSVVHVGYVVAGKWFTLYQPVEKKV